MKNRKTVDASNVKELEKLARNMDDGEVLQLLVMGGVVGEVEAFRLGMLNALSIVLRGCEENVAVNLKEG